MFSSTYDRRERDIVVVGAGSAGAALAGRLSERGRDVLLLEAGTDWLAGELPPGLRHPHTQHGWGVEAVPREYYWPDLRVRRVDGRVPAHYFVGRGLGGGSTINGCYAIRPPLEEFDDWEHRLGCAGWGADDVLPYFIRLENDLDFGDAPFHGREGPIPIRRTPLRDWGTFDLAVRDAALAFGHAWSPDHNAPGAVGVSMSATNIVDSRRVSTNDAYVEPNRRRRNLEIMGGALVDRVLLHGSEAVGVRVRVGGHWQDVHASEVVLCAGALMTPAILQRSGIGPPEALKRRGITPLNALPVGASLQDHPGFTLSVIVREAVPGMNGQRDNCTLRYSLGYPGSGPGDAIIKPMNVAPAGSGWALPGMTPSLPDGPERDHQVGGLLCKLNAVGARGTVLVDSANPVDMPQVQLNLLGDAQDLERARMLMRHAFELLRLPPFEDSVVAVHDETGDAVDLRMSDRDLDRWVRHAVRDTVHPCSSCPIGRAGDARAVVDTRLRVFGVEHLMVADASVTPVVPRANPNLVAVMIGERAADLLSPEP